MDVEQCDKTKACDACESAGSCSSKQKERHEQQRLAATVAHIRHKLMVMSGKGGVGKSTVATNLAAALAARGFRVGILDADIHGPNVAKMLGAERRLLTGDGDGVTPVQIGENLYAVSIAFLGHDPDKAIVWRGPLKHAAIRQFLADVRWGELDFLIIDLPPGTGDEPLSVASLIKEVDGAIVVTTPQEVALLDARKAVNFSNLLRVPVLGIVENMSGLACPHCGESIDLFKTGGGERAAAEMQVPFLGRVPIDPLVVQRCDSGEPVVAGPAASPARAALEAIAAKVLSALEVEAGSGRKQAVF